MQQLNGKMSAGLQCGDARDEVCRGMQVCAGVGTTGIGEQKGMQERAAPLKRLILLESTMWMSGQEQQVVSRGKAKLS